MNYQQLIVLIPSHGLEDLSVELAEKPAASLLNCFACLWHPRFIAATEVLPRWHRADAPEFHTGPNLILVPLPSMELLPAGWLNEARQAGNVIVSGEHEREKILTQALAPEPDHPPLDADLVADFLAFGTTWLFVELLTRRMRSYSNLDEIALLREMQAAARAACDGESERARKHLTVCYEKLLEQRERFYPVECFLLDLCLVTPETAGEQLQQLLLSSVPLNLMAPGKTWRTIVERDPAWTERIRSASERKIVELVGGEEEELVTTLLPLEATIWQLSQGHQFYERTFGVRPVTWGRKRFGLGAHLPQILCRFGYRGALHLLLDDGLYPDDEQTQARWEGSNGSVLNAISRIPLAADGAAAMLRFADRMSESMDMDHVAAVLFARWPDMRTPWMADFRRAHAYAPVLGKFVRFEEFFSHADGPGRRAAHAAADYLSPSLVHAVAAGEANAISRYEHCWQQERDFLNADWARQMSRLLRGQFGPDETAQELERTVREAHPDADAESQRSAHEMIEKTQSAAVADLQALLCTNGSPGPGVLILNPLSFPRKVLVDWPAGTIPPRDPAVLGVQIENERVQALVQLPPCGFLWLRGVPQHSNTAPGKTPLAEELLLRNEHFEVRLSHLTGGIAGIQTYRRSPNRISQQVALRFPHEKLVSTGTGEERQSTKTFYTSMQLRESRILSEGPLIGEVETLGDLIDDHAETVVGTYRQRTRIVRGRPVVEVNLEISPAQEISGDPWTNYIGCRFAWQHIDVALTGSMQQAAQPASSQRLETPQFLEIADDDFRTTLLTPGRPFHRKTGERMLDQLLIVEGEHQRHFRFGVAVDAKYPMQVSLDLYSSPIVIPTSTHPGEESRTGWFFGLSAANVQLTRILPSSRPECVIVRLLETEGRARVLGLQCFRTPRAARQIDFRGETITELHIDDAVNVEISPYEICDVELTF